MWFWQPAMASRNVGLFYICFSLIPSTCSKPRVFFLLISMIYLQQFSWLLFPQNNCLPGEIGGDHLKSLQATICTSRPRTLRSEMQGEKLHRLCRKGNKQKNLLPSVSDLLKHSCTSCLFDPSWSFYESLRTHRSTFCCRFKSLRRDWFLKKMSWALIFLISRLLQTLMITVMSSDVEIICSFYFIAPLTPSALLPSSDNFTRM